MIMIMVVAMVVVVAVLVVHVAGLAVRRVEEVRLQAGDPLQVERVAAEEKRWSRAVFIGRNLDREALKAGFEACAA